MRNGTQTDIPIGLAECLALAGRWAEAYGFELRGLPSLKMVEAVGPEPGFLILDAARDFLGVYREFVRDAIETTEAGNAEGPESPDRPPEGGTRSRLTRTLVRLLF